MKKDKVIEYFDIVLLSEKKDSFFGIYEILIPKYFKEGDTDLTELRSEIKEFSEFHGYFDFFPNGSCKLTEKGLKAKSKGGHLKFLKDQELREEKQDEILDLDLALKRFENKIGKRIIIAGFIIALISFLITVLTLEFWKTDENKNTQNNQIENSLLDKKELILKDSIN